MPVNDSNANGSNGTYDIHMIGVGCASAMVVAITLSTNSADVQR